MTPATSATTSTINLRFRSTILILWIVTNSGCIHINSDPDSAPDALRVPEIKKAYQAKEAIQTQTAVVRNLGNELDGIVTQVSYQVPQVSAADPKSQLIAAVRALREAAREVLDTGPRYLDAIERLSVDMRAGRRSFSGASKLFEAFASEEPYETIADDYRQISKLFAELSRRCNTAQTEFIAKFDRAEFLETLQFIRRQELLLDRYEAALTATFEDPELLEIQRYLAQMNAYAKRYEAFRVQIRDLNRLVPLLEESAPAPSNGSEKKPTDVPAPAIQPLPTNQVTRAQITAPTSVAGRLTDDSPSRPGASGSESTIPSGHVPIVSVATTGPTSSTTQCIAPPASSLPAEGQHRRSSDSQSTFAESSIQVLPLENPLVSRNDHPALSSPRSSEQNKTANTRTSFDSVSHQSRPKRNSQVSLPSRWEEACAFAAGAEAAQDRARRLLAENQ